MRFMAGRTLIKCLEFPNLAVVRALRRLFFVDFLVFFLPWRKNGA